MYCVCVCALWWTTCVYASCLPLLSSLLHIIHHAFLLSETFLSFIFLFVRIQDGGWGSPFPSTCASLHTFCLHFLHFYFYIPFHSGSIFHSRSSFHSSFHPSFHPSIHPHIQDPSGLIHEDVVPVPDGNFPSPERTIQWINKNKDKVQLISKSLIITT